MKTSTLLAYFACFCLGLAIGIISGRQTFPKLITKTVVVEEKLNECENKGGKYSLDWSDSREQYYGICEQPQKELFKYYY